MLSSRPFCRIPWWRQQQLELNVADVLNTRWNNQARRWIDAKENKHQDRRTVVRPIELERGGSNRELNKNLSKNLQDGLFIFIIFTNMVMSKIERRRKERTEWLRRQTDKNEYFSWCWFVWIWAFAYVRSSGIVLVTMRAGKKEGKDQKPSCATEFLVSFIYIFMFGNKSYSSLSVLLFKVDNKYI